MKKFSKKQQKCQKSYKKINQSQILYRIVFKLGAARFCKNFTQIYFKKKCLSAIIGIFLVSKKKKSHFCIKKQPPRRIVDSSIIFLFYVFEAPLLSSGSRAQRRRCRPLSSTCCWRPRPRLQGRPRLYSLGGRFYPRIPRLYIRSDPGG